jgi:hypothetical protein
VGFYPFVVGMTSLLSCLWVIKKQLVIILLFFLLFSFWFQERLRASLSLVREC